MMQLKNVYKEYEDIVALDNVSLTICDGDFVVVYGESGSGKSTLLQVLGGLSSVDRGEYFFDNQDMGVLSKKEMTRFRMENIGFVFQQFYLVPYLSAYENVKLPLFYSHQLDKASRVDSYLKVLGVLPWKYHLPKQLSGGQQQRVCIARALINRPKVLLCDEPTGALDSKSAKQILQILKVLNQQGTTIVLVTHDLRFKNMGNRLLYVNKGRVSVVK